MHPNPRVRAQQQRVRQRADQSDALAFFNLLTSPVLLDEVESLLPEHRERLFPPTETLSMFLSQALSADRSCQRAVNEAAVKRLIGGLSRLSTHTGAYCRARMRLPETMLSGLVQHIGQMISAKVPHPWRWRGHPVRLVDGTTLAMPDTPANEATYPQPRSQAPGLGFPLCRFVGLVCLGSGAVLDAAIGGYRGKGSDEQTLLRTCSIRSNPGICCSGTHITRVSSCSVPCRNAVSRRYSNNRGRVDAVPTSAAVKGSARAIT